MLEAIRRVLDGQVYVSQRISADILDTFTRRGRPGGPTLSKLSDREFEVFQMIGQGLSHPRNRPATQPQH